MKSIKFKFFMFTCSLSFNLQVTGQINLVPNGSFEEFIPFGADLTLTATFPFHIFLDNYTLYPYPAQNTYTAFEAAPDNLFDVVHQIDCWETYDYDVDIENAHYSRTSIIVLSANQGSLYLANPNGVFPFGVPYPPDITGGNTFGVGANILASNTYPTNSDTYVALITNRFLVNDPCTPPDLHPTLAIEKPRLNANLIEELVPDKEYTFSIDVQKIAHLNTYCSDGTYSSLDNKNPKFKVVLHKSDGSGSHTILDWQTVDHTDWQPYTKTFHVNNAGYRRIEIILDREFDQNEGIFIDNVQLYDACETDLNTCENPELFKPLLNIDIHSKEFEVDINGEPTIIKTVEVTGLKVATYAKITITNVAGTITYRTIFEGENPPDVIMWDGKHDNGIVMPNVHYKCKVEASNLCYPLQTFTQKFKKESEIQVFNPVIELNDIGGITISGLEEAALVAVFVEHVTTDIVVFAGISNMPENEIGWNGSTGTNENQYLTPSFVATGYYRVIVILESNCGLEEYQKTLFINEGSLLISYGNGNYTDPLYQWGVVPDKLIPPCDYLINDKPFYRVPKDCCVGDLYLDNEHLWGDMTFNIIGTVYISNSVTADPGSVIIISAGEGIVVSSETVLTLGSNVSLIPSVICEPCDCNKSAELFQDSIIVEKLMLDTLRQVPVDFIQEHVMITPNPATDFISVTIPESKNYSNYEMFNSKGELIQSAHVLTKLFRIDISKYTAGTYFIRFVGESEKESVKLIIQ